jgi:hypothetical protein
VSARSVGGPSGVGGEAGAQGLGVAAPGAGTFGGAQGVAELVGLSVEDGRISCALAHVRSVRLAPSDYPVKARRSENFLVVLNVGARRAQQ